LTTLTVKKQTQRITESREHVRAKTEWEMIEAAMKWLIKFPVFQRKAVLVEIGIHKTLNLLRIKENMPFNKGQLYKAIGKRLKYLGYGKLDKDGQRYNLRKEPVA